METTTALLARTAKRMVSDLDAVEAVVLFGSRARGTARGKSDWDVALLLDREPSPLIWDAVPTLEHVNIICKNREDLRKRALYLGSLESAIVRDGQVLAGEWKRPEQSGERIADNALVRRHLNAAAVGVVSAMHSAGRVLNGAEDSLQDVSHHAQSAAEFTSKAAMMHLDIDPEHAHDLVRLADQIVREKPHDPRTAKWAAAVRGMNGRSKERHVGQYDPAPVDYLERPLEIISTVTEFFAVVLRDITETRDSFAPYTAEVADGVEAAMQAMRGNPSWEDMPEMITVRLGTWEEEVQSIAHLVRSRTQQTARGMGDPNESQGMGSL